MSVDAEIVRVREAIKKVHGTIFGLTNGLQNITHDIDRRLDGFTQEVEGVRGDVGNVRMSVSHITQKASGFPNHAIYLSALLAIDLLIWLVAGFLLWRIIQNCRYGVKNSDQIIAEYEQLVHHPELMDIHVHLAKARRIPPPTAVVVDRNGRSIPLNMNPRRPDRLEDEFGSPSEPLLPPVRSPEERWPPTSDL
ncbi:hypothetical protein M3Y99_01110400 [Aphelenchoides fujianensis]|nr:hypothetical protein M3Y99_01110400 [Aphelenchoides fujianensis]